MTELDKKIKDLKDFIKQKTDQGTANYLGKEIREICGMVETEQLRIGGVVKSLPSKGFISQLAEKRALKFNYVNEIGYLRHKKSFELGAEFVKEHLEKQK